MSLRQIYSDMYKDVYGVRPTNSVEMDEHTLRQELWFLEGQMIELMQQEQERQNKSSQLFWDNIKQMMIDYSIDMPTAIRWCMQSEGENITLEHYLWLNDLSWDEIEQCTKKFGHLISLDSESDAC